jgi:hypothetical protein
MVRKLFRWARNPLPDILWRKIGDVVEYVELRLVAKGGPQFNVANNAQVLFRSN